MKDGLNFCHPQDFCLFLGEVCQGAEKFLRIECSLWSDGDLKAQRVGRAQPELVDAALGVQGFDAPAVAFLKRKARGGGRRKLSPDGAVCGDKPTQSPRGVSRGA